MNWRIPLFVTAVAAFATPSGAVIVANWTQDELLGPIIDSTGNHPLGIATGVPTYAQPGVPNGIFGSITVSNAAGTAIDYGPSTVDEFFVVGADNNNPVLNIDSTASFTAMGWMKSNPLVDAAARTYRIISTGSGNGADRGWGLGLRLTQLDGSSSSIRLTTYGVADNDSQLFSITPGEWLHLAVTYSGGLITYFLNGNMLDSDTSFFGNEGAAARLVIGARLGGNDVDQMNGVLDGIRVYNTVLTQSEIQQAAVDSVSIIPEPSICVLGLIGVAGLMRRKRTRAT